MFSLMGPGIIISCIFPLAALGVAIYNLVKILRCSYRVEAVVENVERTTYFNMGQRSDVRCTGRCSYMYDGMLYTCDRISLTRAHSEGDMIFLYVNPKNPYQVIRRTSLRYMAMGFGFIVGISSIMFMLTILPYKALHSFGTNRLEEMTEQRDTLNNITNNLQDMERKSYQQSVEDTIYREVDYFDIIKSVPMCFSEPIYPNNDKSKGWCSFEHTETGEEICRLYVGTYEGEVNTGMKKLKAYVMKKGKDYSNMYSHTEEGNSIPFYVDKVVVDGSDVFYAYWIIDNKKIIVEHYTSFYQAKTIGIHNISAKYP